MLRILLIDDNPDDRILSVRQLSREFDEIEFEEVLDEADLIRSLEMGEFDLVVTDFQLRWTNGLKILNSIKARYPDCPVVMFTNSGNEEIAVKAMKAGLDDYVVKSPKHYSRLPAAVRSAWERTQAQQRAALLETELQSLLNRLNVGVFCATPDGRLLQGNGAFVRLLGARDLQNAQALLADRWAEVMGELSDEITYQQHAEVEIRRADGSIIWVELSKMLRSKGGQVVIDGLMENVSDRKRVERERAELLEREQAARAAAENANRLKDEFLAVVSHELRSPLNAILGWSSLLRGRKLEPARTAKALESIERNAKLQTQLIEDLLDTSRLIHGRLRLSFGSVQLVPVIEAAVETVRLAAEAKGIHLTTHLDPQVGPVLGDPHRLQQVVWNLLSNAVKFTEYGGSVEVRLDLVDSDAQIAVRDTGQGISAEFLPYVFDRFRQANGSTTRSVGGLGLGLAIVRQLVEMHGGRVSVSSPGEGQGTVFTIALPLYQVGSDRANREPADRVSPVSGQNTSPLEGLQILVLDDETDARDFLTVMLEEYGARVTGVASVAEAKSAIAALPIDIIISDIAMPGEDGYALIRQVRARGESIPAIAVTAYARSEDARKALAEGFHLHLAKPIEPDRLVKAIAHLTGRSDL